MRVLRSDRLLEERQLRDCKVRRPDLLLWAVTELWLGQTSRNSATTVGRNHSSAGPYSLLVLVCVGTSRPFFDSKIR